MTDQGSLDGLQGLHQDLIALDQTRLRNIDKLWADLQARMVEFRKLLDKTPKNEGSRKRLLTGMHVSLVMLTLGKAFQLTRCLDRANSDR